MAARWRDWLTRLAGDARAQYVVINVAVNGIFLLRILITMLILGFRELGLVTIAQTIIIAIAALQFGFLQGGYRLLCSADTDEGERINNALHSILGVIALAALAALAASALLLDSSELWLVAAIGVAGGIFTLYRNWLTNALIARDELPAINRYNAWSGVSALASFALIPLSPLYAALAALLAPPLLFTLLVWAGVPASRPHAIELSPPLLRQMLAAGFILFLTGIFTQVNMQVERWYVAGDLGLEALGHLYLVFLYLTIFQLVPNSLDAIFLPRAVRAHAANDPAEQARTMRIAFLVTGAYVVLAIGATLVLTRPVVGVLMPRYLGDVDYLFAFLPGLAIITFIQPLSLIFYVLIDYRYYLWGYGVTTVLTLLVFGAAAASRAPLDLLTVVEIRAAGLVLTALVVLWGFWRMSALHPQFRFPLMGKAA